MVAIPHKRRDPDKYAAFVKSLGIPAHLAVLNNPDDKNEHAPVDLHYNGVCEYVTELQRQGKPLPPGVDPEKTYPVFKLKLRKKKAVDSGVGDANQIV